MSNKIDKYLLIRFIAALLVIRQHADFAYPNYKIFDIPIGWTLFGNNNSGGNAVVVFFALSAFLMAKNFFNGKYKFGFRGIIEYYFNRFKRIAPLYYLVTIFTIIMVFPYPIEKVDFLWDILTFNYYNHFPFNQVYWTISIEIAFYIICPIIFFLFKKINFSTVIGLILFAFSIWYTLNVQSFGFLKYTNQLSLIRPLTGFTAVFAWLGIFLAPSSLALLIQDIKSKQKYKNITNFLENKNYLVWITFFILVLVVMVPFELLGIKDINLWQVYLTLATSIFIFTKECCEPVQIREKTKEKQVDRVSFIEKIRSSFVYGGIATTINNMGRLTYSIYLIHMLFMYKVNENFRSMLVAQFSEMKAGYIVFALVSIMSIIGSYILYISVEIPAIKALDKFTSFINNLTKKDKII